MSDFGCKCQSAKTQAESITSHMSSRIFHKYWSRSNCSQVQKVSEKPFKPLPSCKSKLSEQMYVILDSEIKLYIDNYPGCSQ